MGVPGGVEPPRRVQSRLCGTARAMAISRKPSFLTHAQAVRGRLRCSIDVRAVVRKNAGTGGGEVVRPGVCA
jgi:hypothetical protein